ncbi:MAG: hypothetical protein AAB403_19970 [Planctomycetota bacterium]
MIDGFSAALIIGGGTMLFKWLANAVGSPARQPRRAAPPQPPVKFLDVPPGHKVVVNKEDAEVIGNLAFVKQHRILEDEDGAYYEQNLEIPPYDAEGNVLHDPRDACYVWDPAKGAHVWLHKESAPKCAQCGHRVPLDQLRRVTNRRGQTAWFCLECLAQYGIDTKKASLLGMIENQNIEGKLLPQPPENDEDGTGGTSIARR